MQKIKFTKELENYEIGKSLNVGSDIPLWKAKKAVSLGLAEEVKEVKKTEKKVD